MSVLVAFKATGAGADVEGAAGAGICAAGGARLLGSHPAARVSGHPPLIGISRDRRLLPSPKRGPATLQRRNVDMSYSKAPWRRGATGVCAPPPPKPASAPVYLPSPSVDRIGIYLLQSTATASRVSWRFAARGSPALGSFVVSPSLRLKFLARHMEQFARERLKPIHRRFAAACRVPVGRFSLVSATRHSFRSTPHRSAAFQQQTIPPSGTVRRLYRRAR